MKKPIICFLPYANEKLSERIATELQGCPHVKQVFFLDSREGKANDTHDKYTIIHNQALTSSKTLQAISKLSSGNHILIYTQYSPFSLGYKALERMADYLESTGCAMVYADHNDMQGETLTPHPVCDYQPGSVRDDFDFGSLLMFGYESFAQAACFLKDTSYAYSALYALRLELSRHATIFHIRENLYTEVEEDARPSGEKQFDYVDPRNREVQREREAVFTAYLKQIGAFLQPASKQICPTEGDFDCEASVIIPVKNRVRTISNAIQSALSQQTDFPFNIIIIDNHSTDGTSEAIDCYDHDKRVIHLIPERTDLGIGGCWDWGINHPACGRFAIQLDSDDLYSSPHTLQTIVDKFYQEKCAMVIGTYQMTNFNLQPIPPGVIDHKEWTPANGHNNALRINGLGAPRAFFTPLLRETSIPNTSYGEDYALGLTLSRDYAIGRIYDVLYLCRRWEGNSDAALSIEKTNRNNSYKDSLRTHEIEIRKQRNHSSGTAQLKEMYAECHTPTIDDFFNLNAEIWPLLPPNLTSVKDNIAPIGDMLKHLIPGRRKSTLAQVDQASIAKRPCFLCRENKPEEQLSLTACFDEPFSIRINPYPILPHHLTISSLAHQPQTLADKTSRQLPGRILKWMAATFGPDSQTRERPSMTLFYNGASCGASAPDHFHFQAADAELIPLIRLIKSHPDKDFIESGQAQTPDGHGCRSYRVPFYHCPVQIFVTQGSYQTAPQLIDEYLQTLPLPDGEKEPMFNMLAWYDEERDTFTQAYIPRSKHRPACYYQQADKQILVSPGALDMAGHIVTIRPEDFQRLTPQMAIDILAEVGYHGISQQTHRE